MYTHMQGPVACRTPEVPYRAVRVLCWNNRIFACFLQCMWAITTNDDINVTVYLYCFDWWYSYSGKYCLVPPLSAFLLLLMLLPTLLLLLLLSLHLCCRFWINPEGAPCPSCADNACRICIHDQHLLSRVGDRPTATILHAQFHLLIFAHNAKYSTKVCPS